VVPAPSTFWSSTPEARSPGEASPPEDLDLVRAAEEKVDARPVRRAIEGKPAVLGVQDQHPRDRLDFQDLASLIGVTRESVNLALSDFRGVASWRARAARSGCAAPRSYARWP
jgi:hypothetical protein